MKSKSVLSSEVFSSFNPGGIQSIYEKGEQNSFGVKLDKFINLKKKDINSICNENYEVFLQSINKLKETKERAFQLKDKVQELDSKVQESGKKILYNGKKIIEYKKTQQNIKNCKHIVKYCHFLSEVFVKAVKEINLKQYYKAINTLNDVTKYIKNVQYFKFTEYFFTLIPKFRKRIKLEIEQEFNQWLSFVRNKIENVGDYMVNVMRGRLHKRRNKVNEKNKLTNLEKKLKYDSVSLMTSQHIIGEEDSAISVNAFESAKIDFTSVYRFQLIYDTLKEDASTYYRNNRYSQIQGFISKFKTSIDDGNITMKNLEQLLNRVVGFYAIENYVLETTTNLNSKFDIIKQWEIKLIEIKQILESRFKDTGSADYFLKLKKCVSCFCFTMNKFLGLYVSPIIDMIQLYKTQYSNLLLQNSKQKMEKIFRDEDYKFLEVPNFHSYEKLLEFKLENENVLKYPYNCRFSKTVKELCECFKMYITQFFQYTQYLSNIDDTLVKGINQIMKLVIEKCEEKLRNLDRKDLTKSTIIYLNIHYIKKSFKFIIGLYFDERKEYQVSTDSQNLIEDEQYIENEKVGASLFIFQKEYERIINYADEILKLTFEHITDEMFKNPFITLTPREQIADGNKLFIEMSNSHFKSKVLTILNLFPEEILEKKKFFFRQSIIMFETSFFSYFLHKDNRYLDENGVTKLIVDFSKIFGNLTIIDEQQKMIDDWKFCFKDVLELLQFVDDQQINIENVNKQGIDNFVALLKSSEKQKQRLGNILVKFKNQYEFKHSKGRRGKKKTSLGNVFARGIQKIGKTDLKFTTKKKVKAVNLGKNLKGQSKNKLLNFFKKKKKR